MLHAGLSILLFATPPPAPAAAPPAPQVEPGLSTRVVSDVLALGAPVELELIVPKQESGVVITPPESSEHVRVLTSNNVQNPDGTSTIRYSVQPLQVGDVEVPLPTVRAEGNALSLAPVRLHIPDPLANVQEPELAPLRGLRKVPLDIPWREILFILAAIALCFIAIRYLWRRLRGRKRQPLHSGEVLPSTPVDGRTAWQRALDALDGLAPPEHESPDQARARVDDVSDVLRVYLEERFALNAPDSTTQEFLSASELHPALTTHRDFLREFLYTCDRVKFAGEKPSRDSVNAVLRGARMFVTETIPPATLQVAQGGRP